MMIFTFKLLTNRIKWLDTSKVRYVLWKLEKVIDLAPKHPKVHHFVSQNPHRQLTLDHYQAGKNKRRKVKKNKQRQNWYFVTKIVQTYYEKKIF